MNVFSKNNINDRDCLIFPHQSSRGVETGGGYIGIYTPNQSTLNCFMWLFCLLDPFIPTQIKFLATPLQSSATAHCTVGLNKQQRQQHPFTEYRRSNELPQSCPRTNAMGNLAVYATIVDHIRYS